MNEFRNTLLSDGLWLNEPKEGSENAAKLSFKKDEKSDFWHVPSSGVDAIGRQLFIAEILMIYGFGLLSKRDF